MSINSVCVCVHAHVHSCMHVCVCVCTHMHACVCLCCACVQTFIKHLLSANGENSISYSTHYRFEDISVDIRKECIKYSKHFIVYHPEQVQTIAGLNHSVNDCGIICCVNTGNLEKIKQRELDPDEQIRQEVVKTICEAAAESITCVPDMVKSSCIINTTAIMYMMIVVFIFIVAV